MDKVNAEPHRNPLKEISRAFSTLIPARLDRLPWSGFHWQILIALGITWSLDGLEVTLIGSVSGALQNRQSLALTSPQIGMLGSAYILGAVLGALGFGYLTDVLGRKKLFFITLGVYVVGVLCSSFSWSFWSFAVFRFITGAGIGGEYAAINSAIDELVPARLRGRIGLTLNGTYWVGAALGSLSTVWLLNPAIFNIDFGWRLGFGIGGVLGLATLLLRGSVPESPRWLLLRGREKEAELVTQHIESHVAQAVHSDLGEVDPQLAIHIRAQKPASIGTILKTMFFQYRERSVLGLVLMAAQAFLYNAIFFTYTLVLIKFYAIPADRTGLYILPFAVGNFLGPVLLGPLFDTVGRRKMITFTYVISGLLLAVTGFAFARGYLTATTQTLAWSVIFFFASAAASSAYLTVSEIFPLETRAMAIAIFYCLGTGIGGIFAPWIFGTLIQSGSRISLMNGYLAASLIMITAGIVEWRIGVDSEGKSLEQIALPLSAAR